jgi:hypothetical protein
MSKYKKLPSLNPSFILQVTLSKGTMSFFIKSEAQKGLFYLFLSEASL